VICLVGLDALGRAWRPRPPGRLAESLETVVLIALVIAGAGGLGLLVGGSTPAEPLHFVYAILAFASLPVANSLARNASLRRQALTTCAGALVAIVLVTRLFQTG
jgi:hypothetical protein